MLEALKKNLGNVTLASKAVGIERTLHYYWIKNDEEYVKELNDLDDIVLDFAEASLYKQIKEGSTPATVFYLKSKGKARGYSDKTEVVHEISNFDIKDIVKFK